MDDAGTKGISCTSVCNTSSQRYEAEKESISMKHVREEAEGRAVEYVEPNHTHCPLLWERPTDLGDIAKSSFSASGSDHTRSAMGPS